MYVMLWRLVQICECFLFANHSITGIFLIIWTQQCGFRTDSLISRLHLNFGGFITVPWRFLTTPVKFQAVGSLGFNVPIRRTVMRTWNPDIRMRTPEYSYHVSDSWRHWESIAGPLAPTRALCALLCDGSGTLTTEPRHLLISTIKI